MLLDQLNDFLVERVDPYANQLDTDAHLLKSRFIELGEQGLLAVKVAKKFHGIEASRALTYDYFARLASSSYALTFLAVQHESCASLVQKGSNHILQADLLPRMVQGQFSAGVGIYHLRRHAKQSMISAEKVIGGYRVTGHLDWVSGFEIFDHIALGFVINGREMVGLAPFSQQNDRQNSGIIEIGPVQSVTAVSATNTIAIKFNNWLISDHDIIIDHEGSVIEQRAALSITHATVLMGIFQAALNIISSSKYTQSQDAIVLKQLNQLNTQHRYLRDELLNSKTAEQIQQVRAQIHGQTRDCIYLAAATSGGRAVLPDHPVQRLNRELLQATVSGVSSLFIHSLCASMSDG